MRSLLLIVFLIMNPGISQDKYPADTLLRSPTSSILEKATILPISAWQRLSYNSVLLSWNPNIRLQCPDQTQFVWRQFCWTVE